MADPVLLSFEKHGKLRLSDSRDFTQFKSQHLVPVVFQEFYSLAAELPLVFVRNSETGGFLPVAMMGLRKGSNLFCQNSSWQQPFLPSSFTLAPLSLHKLQSDTDDAVVAIDEESKLLSESVGESLFQSNGEFSNYLQKRIDQIVTVTKQSLQAVTLCQFLADKNLLKTGLLALQYDDSSPRYEVEGVYTIDEDMLEKIADEEYLELRRRGLISLIYSHLTSLSKFKRLLLLQNQVDTESHQR